MNQTLFIGKYHIHLNEVDSTNTYLQKCSEATLLSEGTVVSTNFQSKGKGQRGTVWQSEPSVNILLSVLLYPKFLKADEQFLLSQCVALAICQMVGELLPEHEVRIKWPNDIMVDSRKVCGVLIENSLLGGNLKSSVVGIGLNVNDDCNGLPLATSLKIAAGRPFQVKDLEERLFAALESRYLQLRQGSYERIRQDYTEKLYGLGKELCYRDNLRDETILGQVVGVTLEGKLKLQTSIRMLEFGLKEISLL